MSLQELETVLGEFFGTGTSAARKQEIESVLNSFRAQQDAYRQCAYFLQNTQSQYVQWFSLSVYEDVVMKDWPKIERTEKDELRDFLFHYLQTHYRTIPNFVSAKLIKIIVDVAKHDWPQHFFDLFPRIQRLLHDSNTTSLALSLLKTISEEFVSTRETISANRKAELRSTLNAHMSGILDLVISFLNTKYDSCILGSASSSMPSPSESAPFIPGHSGLELLSPSRPACQLLLPVIGLSPTTNLHSSADHALNFTDATNKFVIGALIDLDTELCCRLALEILQSLLSWISLSEHVSANFLDTIIRYSQLCNDRVLRLGILGMSCVNEIIGRNYVPQDFMRFLVQIFRHIFEELKFLTDLSATTKVEELDDDYRSKFTEFIGLFVQHHIQRTDTTCQFPISDFMSLFYRYTFMQPNVESFESCLHIWGDFLEFLSTKKSETDQTCPLPKSHPIRSYQEGLLTVVRTLVNKTQITGDDGTLSSEIADLDCVNEDAEGQSEWDRFLIQCMEITANIAELFPDEVFQVLFLDLVNQVDSYYQMQHYISANGMSKDITRFCKNISTTFRLFGRLADVLVHDFDRLYPTASVLIAKFVEMLVYTVEHQMFRCAPEFVSVTAQLLAAVKAYVHWFSLLQISATSDSERMDQFNRLYLQIVDTTITVLRGEATGKLHNISALFFWSLTATVRPDSFLEIPSVREYVSNVHAEAVLLPVECKVLVYQSISNALLLPARGAKPNEQDWINRATRFVEFANGLTGPYIELAFTQGSTYHQPETKSRIRHTVVALAALLDSIKSEGTKPKLVLYEGIKNCLHVSLDYFQVYIQNNDNDTLEDISAFFLVLVQCLRKQLGTQFIGEILNTFLKFLSGDQLRKVLTEENTKGAEILNKFLLLLQAVVEDSGKAFDLYLPDVINFCIDELYTKMSAMAQYTTTIEHIQLAYYNLIYKIILHNFNYFFPVSNVRQFVGDPGKRVEGAESSTKNEGHFSALLHAIAHSFSRPGIDVFRANCVALESLNERCHIYQNELFQKTMLFPFLEILLNVLMNKTHDLLRDDIVQIVHHMAAVDTETFLGRFIPLFLAQRAELGDDYKNGLHATLQRLRRDPISEHETIYVFLNDYFYFRRL